MGFHPEFQHVHPSLFFKSHRLTCLLVLHVTATCCKDYSVASMNHAVYTEQRLIYLTYLRLMCLATPLSFAAINFFRRGLV